MTKTYGAEKVEKMTPEEMGGEPSPQKIGRLEGESDNGGPSPFAPAQTTEAPATPEPGMSAEDQKKMGENASAAEKSSRQATGRQVIPPVRGRR